jgi:TonB family protein
MSDRGHRFMSEVNWKKLKGRIVAGKFPLIDWLGGSDHSAVFLTEFPAAGTSRAVVKLVRQGPDTEKQLSRLREAAELSHAHLLRILEVGPCEIDGNKFIYVVQEYAEEDLSQILPQRSLTPTETRDLLPPILDVLSHIHSSGFVHTRIRPSNILAVGDQLKLSPDSLRRPSDSFTRQRNPDIYDAPEVAQGTISPAGDIWSLGVTLLTALTQRTPEFPNSASDPAVPEPIPEPFRSIVRECLHRNPNQRCTTGSITALLDPEEQSASARPLPAITRGSFRSHYWIPIAAALVLVALFAGSRFVHHNESSAQSEVAGAAAAPSDPDSHTPLPATRRSANLSNPAQGAVLRQVVPEVPRSARNTIRGRIRVVVRVAVDPSGKVQSSKLTTPGPSHYFANLALRAAQQWQFTPPRVNGEEVASTWSLRFQFSRASTQVFPSQERR